jgi:DNA-binding NarL/FixJ family response regulator
MESIQRIETTARFVPPGRPGRVPGEAEIASIEDAVVMLRRHWCLTASEACVLHHGAQGSSERSIAFRMGYHVSTIRRIRKSIGEKSGLADCRRAVFEVWRLATQGA